MKLRCLLFYQKFIVINFNKLWFLSFPFILFIFWLSPYPKRQIKRTFWSIMVCVLKCRTNLNFSRNNLPWLRRAFKNVWLAVLLLFKFWSVLKQIKIYYCLSFRFVIKLKLFFWFSLLIFHLQFLIILQTNKMFLSCKLFFLLMFLL